MRIATVAITSLAALSCAAPDAPFAETPEDPAAPASTLAAVGEFAFTLDLAPRSADATGATGHAAQAVVAPPISVAPGDLGPNSVMIGSANRVLNCAPYADGSICADVTITSRYAGPLRNVFFQIETMTPVGLNTARNSDTPLPGTGLSTTFGLWSYGEIPGLGTGTRQWVFDTRSGNTTFRFFGHAYADLPCPHNANRAACGPGAACAKLDNDEANCGWCGHACPAGDRCRAGHCR